MRVNHLRRESDVPPSSLDPLIDSDPSLSNPTGPWQRQVHFAPQCLDPNEEGNTSWLTPPTHPHQSMLFDRPSRVRARARGRQSQVRKPSIRTSVQFWAMAFGQGKTCEDIRGARASMKKRRAGGGPLEILEEEEEEGEGAYLRLRFLSSQRCVQHRATS